MKKVMYLLLVVLLSAMSQALIYVDANRDNVSRADGSGNVWWTTSSYSGDDLWRERYGEWGLADSATTLPPIGSTVPGGDIYQSIDSGQVGKDACALQITIDGVSAGDHLYVIFWSDQAGSPWSIRAGLDLGTLTTFSPYSGAPTEWAYDSAGRKMWVGDLGAVASAGSYTIYIDDLPTDDSNQRTWFDGVAAGEIPEPATLILLGLGSLAMLRKRK